jgi:RNAse (barnase) inhibitor barstar
MGTDVAGDCDHCPSGVYLIDGAARERILRHGAFPSGFAVVALDGAAAGSRTGFFQEISHALRFPAYFGRNWDAVYDCLTDPSWLPTAAGYVLVLDGFDQFATDEPEQWNIALKVLREACAFWQPLTRPMCALLYGPSELAPGVPSLPSACLSSWPDA